VVVFRDVTFLPHSLTPCVNVDVVVVVMVCSIIRDMVKSERRVLSKDDIVFLLTVLKDADSLSWDEGQLERRKRAVRAVIMSRIRELGNDRRKQLGMLKLDADESEDDEEEDELFARLWSCSNSSLGILLMCVCRFCLAD
jgi:hypothetical protein